MTKEQYLANIRKFDVINSLSSELRQSYMNADQVTFETNLRMLELAQGDVKSAKKTYLTAVHEAAAVYEKDAQTARHDLTKKAESRVQTSDEAAAEKLIQNL